MQALVLDPHIIMSIHTHRGSEGQSGRCGNSRN